MTNKLGDEQSKLTQEYIDMLSVEGARARQICEAFQTQTSFIDQVSKLGKQGINQSSVTAWHILMHDLVTLYRDYITDLGNKPLSTKAKFIVVYFYEYSQSKDLKKRYTVSQLNKILHSARLDVNFSTILDTKFFIPHEELSHSVLLPEILNNKGAEHAEVYTSWLIRIMTLVAQANDQSPPNLVKYIEKIKTKITKPLTIPSYGVKSDVPDDDSLEKVMADLNDLIGLDSIKQSIKDLTNFLKIQKIREEKGLKTNLNSLHAVFMGPPGTGKTTIARLLGRIYKHLGYLHRGHVIETDRVGMVAGYVGQTAIKSDEIIKSAKGGVLFIDEAYALVSGGFNDYGNEAIEILLKRMEDYRRELVVVVAGYPDEMEVFIKSNPGLQSRFNRYFTFEHYTPDALMDIFQLYTAKSDFKLTEDAEDKLREIVDRVYEKRHPGFGNARIMRNLFEKIIEHQANRIIELDEINEDTLRTIQEEDIPGILKTVQDILVFQEEESTEESDKSD